MILPAKPFKRYDLAILAAILALTLREALTPLLGTTNPYHTTWAAVILVSWYCGMGPAILTTSLCLAGVWYVFLPPYHSFFGHDRGQVFGTWNFLLLSALLIVLGERERRNRERGERTEGALKESEEQFRTLANALPELCWMAHPDGEIFWYNERWYQYTGTKPQEMLGWGWQSVHDPVTLPEVLKRWRDCIQTGLQFEMEFPLRAQNGEFRWFLTRVRPLRNSQGQVVRWFGINTDIDEQHAIREALTVERQHLEERVAERTRDLSHANDGLRELSGRLLNAQDAERRKLARELHDSVGQLLAAMSMNVGLVATQPLESKVAKAVSETAELLEQANREVRTISHLLHPPLLDELGLSSTIRSYVEGFSERSKIKVAISIPADLGRFSGDVEIATFRIVQECLTNIHRHSGSEEASIRISRGNNGLELEIADSGRGIPETRKKELKSSGRTGVGFRGMRERVGHLGGKFDFSSSESGTVITIALPVSS